MSLLEHFEVRIPSDTSEGQKVQERIVASLEQAEFSDRDIFGVRLALEEALVNAIKHGNRMDLEKSVRIECWIYEHKVRIEIEDEGEGFKPESIPDPTLEENLERPCGRGIMLMNAFMTKIEYNDSGNCIILEKTRDVAEENEEAAD